MRTILVYLLIGGLLLCPYNCAVKRAAAQGVQSEAPDTCCEACRARRASMPAAPAHPQPAPDDNQSCFCEGAAFDTQSRVEIAQPQAERWTWVIDPGQPIPSSFELAHGDLVTVPPADVGGIAARISFCSLLL